MMAENTKHKRRKQPILAFYLDIFFFGSNILESNIGKDHHFHGTLRYSFEDTKYWKLLFEEKKIKMFLKVILNHLFSKNKNLFKKNHHVRKGICWEFRKSRVELNVTFCTKYRIERTCIHLFNFYSF
jgi:hypothetical protein